ERAEQGQRGAGLQQRRGTSGGREDRADPLARGAVAHLVVVLQEAQEPVCGGLLGVQWASVAPSPVGRVGPVMDEDRRERLLERLQGAEVAVVALSFTREGGVQGVVGVVAPLRGTRVVSRLCSTDEDAR